MFNPNRGKKRETGMHAYFEDSMLMYVVLLTWSRLYVTDFGIGSNHTAPLLRYIIINVLGGGGCAVIKEGDPRPFR